jgi:hypothetical protein
VSQSPTSWSSATSSLPNCSRFSTPTSAKLAEAQQAQADVLRKQRELDDARRELDLNVEKKVQESLAAVHAKAKLDAQEGLKAKLSEKEQQVASMKIQMIFAERPSRACSRSRAKRWSSNWKPCCAPGSRAT